MSSMLNDTMNTAKSALSSAKEGLETAKVTTEHAATTTRSVLLEGFKAVSGVVTMLRHLDGDDALGWVGLARKSSPLRSLGVFGAGVAVGAGLGMVFAPMSGAKLRRTLLSRLTDAADEAKETVEHAGAQVSEKVTQQVSQVEDKAKDLAGKAGEAVKSVEDKAKDMAGKASDTAKSVEHKVEDKLAAGVDAVKGAANKMEANKNGAEGKTATPNNKPQTTAGGQGHLPS